MNIVSWILFGLIAGVIANLIDPSPNRNGIIGTTILGILGALVGGYLGNLLFGVGVTGFNLSSFIIAVVGALALLIVQRALTSRSY
ncbi:GlsB/YeaQ/YmgE family stress response membrane protein [Candidatus Daviesbacteria bacterium]|nr:GlsB/YeaQ/YmgE family stress response membrane protein [Candidatus Daviesbacteria bacterium]